MALVFGVLLPFVIERTDDGADPVSVAMAGFRGETQSGAEVAFSPGFVGLTVLAVALAGLQLQGLGTGPGTEYRGRAQLVLGLLVLVGSFVPYSSA